MDDDTVEVSVSGTVKLSERSGFWFGMAAGLGLVTSFSLGAFFFVLFNRIIALIGGAL